MLGTTPPATPNPSVPRQERSARTTPCPRRVMTIKALLPFFFSSSRRHTRFKCDWSSDVCSSDLQVGNVNTGASDPMREVCAAGKAAGAWVHVDGAFGLWAAASRSRRGTIAGTENADSWATDGHKWLQVPYDCGIAFVRDR